MITDLAPDHVQPWFLRGEQGELAVLVNFGGAAYLTEISNRVLQIDGRLELDHAYRCCFLVHVKMEHFIFSPGATHRYRCSEASVATAASNV